MNAGALSTIVFDLDNTIYDFSYVFSPAFRGMVRALSVESGLSIDEITASAKRVFERYRALEYPFLIREMDVFSQLNAKQRLALAELAQSVFGRVRDKRLLESVYPNALETLAALSAAGHAVIALTNASLYQAFKRLKTLRAVQYFNAIVACENYAIPPDIVLRANARPWEMSQSLRFSTFKMADRKPSNVPFGIAAGIFPNYGSLYMVGDNLITDIQASKDCGFITIWARYGTIMDEKNRKTMVDLTPSAVSSTWTTLPANMPDYTINNISEITAIVPSIVQASLW